MANASDTSPYILSSNDSSLPNSQQLVVGSGLSAASGGAGGDFTISPSLGLASLANLNTPGILSFNSNTKNITPRTFSSNGSVSITNPDGVNGTPIFNVIPNTTTQLVSASANGGSSVGNYPELHFTGSGGASCSVSADAANNRFIVNYNTPTGSGTGSVTSVGASSPNSTLTIGGTNPITDAGILTFDLPTTGVVAGTYSSANINVDAYGRLTFAANGSGGGGGGTVSSVQLASPSTSLTISGTNPITTGGIINVDMPAVISAGSYTNANVTVDIYGRVRTISNGIAGGTGTVTSVGVTSTNGTLTVTGSPITTSGTINVALPMTSVVAGSYTNPNLTIDSFGRITSAVNGSSIGSILGTANQISANTVSGTTTLSIPSDFRVPGTLTFPNTTQSSGAALSYYTSGSSTYQLRFVSQGNPGTAYTLSVLYERIGSQVFVSFGSTSATPALICDTGGDYILYSVTAAGGIPSAYIPAINSGPVCIGTGFLRVYNSSDVYQYTLGVTVLLNSNGATNGSYFQFILNSMNILNGDGTYTLRQPVFISGYKYYFGAQTSGAWKGINFNYSTRQGG